jgi:DNA polymerase III subunit alpha
MRYVSLHNHSTYSYMDGFGRPAAHIARVGELGMEALALTEHGNVSSHVQLEKAGKKDGIRPIFGLEAYTEVIPKSRKKFHLTILAGDDEGYRNLMRITSRAWAEGFYQWPTVNGQMLRDHHDGLIVLSGCSDSLLACSLLGGKMIDPKDASPDRAREVARRFKRLLGDRFYLEVQMFPELERSGHINRFYEQLSKELKIPLVATGDVHYPYPDDNEMQVILHAAGRGAGSVAAQEASWEYDIRLTYPETDRVALDRLMGAGLSKRAAQEAIANTVIVASRCNVQLPKAELLRYPTEAGETSKETIWRWMREGWRYRVDHGNRRMLKWKADYVERVKHEMEEIEKKDYIDYFLMLSDIVRYSKSNGVAVGPARGSAAASLVCYLLRITEIDPMEYPLMMFDRFIDPTRTDIPDIDLDFDDERRWKVREYAVQRYGADRVGNIANYSRFKGKTSVNDICRVFRIPKAVAKEVNDRIVERSGGDSRDDFSLLDTVDMFPTVKALFEKHQELYKATRLEGNYRGMSVHAAGIVIANQPIPNICGLYTRKSAHGEQIQVVSVDKYDAEYLGLMKADFLGLSTMGMISIALELAGLTLEDLYAIPINDPETIAAFTKNDVIGIFQFEGRATRLVCREVRPTTFADISDVNALSRPGPLFSGTTAEYIKVRRGELKPTKFHPIIDGLTKNTHGQIIYQEQILKGLREFGGLPVTRVHEIRRIISKKLGEAQFNTSRDGFVEGAMSLHGVSEEVAKAVWGRLVTSASYAFNIAHSISYSLLGFWCMWLKTHYPVAFYTAQLRKTADEKWPVLIKDAERHQVHVSGVDPMGSGRTWTPVSDPTVHRAGGRIRAGLLQLPGIGEAKVAAIEAFRESGGTLRTAEDFLQVKGIGPKMVEKLQGSVGNPDPFGLRMARKMLNEVRGSIRRGEIPLRMPTHKSDDMLDLRNKPTVVWMGIPKAVEYNDYVEDQRARYGLEVAEIKAKMKRPDLVSYASFLCFDDGDEDVYLRFNRFVFPKFKKAIESVRIGRDVLWVRATKNDTGFGVSLAVQKMCIFDPFG